MVFREIIFKHKKIKSRISSLDDFQREEILSLIEETFTVRMIDALLEEVQEDKREEFLELVTLENEVSDDELVGFLKNKVTSPEDLLKTRSLEILEELCDF